VATTNFRDGIYIIDRERRHRAVPTAANGVRKATRARSATYLAIPHKSVSRRHAELVVLDGTLYLRDRGSKNATYVLREGRRVPIDEDYIAADDAVIFGRCVRRIGDLVRARQAGG